MVDQLGFQFRLGKGIEVIPLEEVPRPKGEGVEDLRESSAAIPRTTSWLLQGVEGARAVDQGCL